MRFECVSRTHVGLKREINEDSLLADTDGGLWVVADGMGGHDAGEVASAMVVDGLRRIPHGHDVDRFVANAIDALHEVNAQLIGLAGSAGTERTIGTTVVGVAVEGDQFRCFWAGDSRAYRMREGALIRLSRDHSLVQELVDVGMLRPDEVEGHANANVITRAVGVRESVEIDIVSGEAMKGDLFLVASDGLTRVVDDQEISLQLQSGPLEEVADRLIETVLARGAPDNVSLIITRLV
jgi:serine/threonine-protein phosphatase Stp1